MTSVLSVLEIKVSGTWEIAARILAGPVLVADRWLFLTLCVEKAELSAVSAAVPSPPSVPSPGGSLAGPGCHKCLLVPLTFLKKKILLQTWRFEISYFFLIHFK